MTAIDEQTFLDDPHGLWASLAKSLYGMSCDHRAKGGTMDLIDKNKSGEVYMCRCCGRIMRLGYIGGGR